MCKSMKTQVLISLVVILIATNTLVTAQTVNTEHIVKVEINNNAHSYPNLIMKIKRTVAERKTDILNWASKY